MNQPRNIAVVRHVKTNKLYRYLGDSVYVNLYTGQMGTVEDDEARKIFVINLEMTQIIAEYPLVEEMITRLKMIIDK